MADVTAKAVAAPVRSGATRFVVQQCRAQLAEAARRIRETLHLRAADPFGDLRLGELAETATSSRIGSPHTGGPFRFPARSRERLPAPTTDGPGARCNDCPDQASRLSRHPLPNPVGFQRRTGGEAEAREPPEQADALSAVSTANGSGGSPGPPARERGEVNPSQAHATPPGWLAVLAWAWLIGCGLCAIVIIADTYLARHRQRMPVMEAVWPVNALYLGPAAVWAYLRWGRRPPAGARPAQGDPPAKPGWVSTVVSVMHCGAGCTLGDIVAETVIFATGLAIAGTALWAEYTGDFLLALALGIVFQYFAIAPMRGLPLGTGLWQAAKADVLSLTAFEVGLFAWMALMAFVFFPHPRLHPDNPVYWFLMQIGMVIGFVTAYPVNAWLIRRAIKERM
jgi:uncharacterized protein DUF4396